MTFSWIVSEKRVLPAAVLLLGIVYAAIAGSLYYFNAQSAQNLR